MHADIDYMDKFKVFTLGEEFALKDVRDFVNKLHDNNQHYIVMVDPGTLTQSLIWQTPDTVQLWQHRTIHLTTEALKKMSF